MVVPPGESEKEKSEKSLSWHGSCYIQKACQEKNEKNIRKGLTSQSRFGILVVLEAMKPNQHKPGRPTMANHESPYAASEKLKRFNDAVGPNKLFGTGEGVIRAFRMMSKGHSVESHHISEVLDVLGAGIALALEDSFKQPQD